MKKAIFFAFALCWVTGAWAADTIQPLDVKLGLWEMTHTTQTTGQLPIPADMLAKLTPEQRAKFDQMMKEKAAEGPKTETRKHCVTKEELSRANMMGDNDKACTRTVITSTKSKLEAKIECTRQNAKETGDYKIEAVDSSDVKGSMQMVMTGGSNTMRMNSTFSGKYIGPACGTTK